MAEVDRPSNHQFSRTELVATACGLHANSKNAEFRPGLEAVAKWAGMMFGAADEIERWENALCVLAVLSVAALLHWIGDAIERAEVWEVKRSTNLCGTLKGKVSG